MFCATDIIAVSESLKSKIVELKLAKSNKIKVLGFGSSNGVDIEKFNKQFNSIPFDIKEAIRDILLLDLWEELSKIRELKK